MVASISTKSCSNISELEEKLRNCLEHKKFLETKKVARNTRSCQKVAEQLVEALFEGALGVFQSRKLSASKQAILMLIKVSVPSFKQGSYIHLAIIRNFISFKADLPNLSKTLPLVIFGVFGILAGILAFWLPETLYSPLAQTVEQAEAWDEDYKIYCCRRHRSAKEEIIMEMSDNEEANDSLMLT